MLVLWLLPVLSAFVQPGLFALQIGVQPALPDEAAEGGRIFQQKCAVCHLPIARDGEKPYASRLDGALMARDGYARRVIADGNASGMPGWKYTLRPEQLDALLAYLTTLDSPDSANTGLAHGGSTPRSVSPGEQDARLAGTVTAASGKPLEGVTVSARLADRPITTSVFTDDRGAYAFPPMERGRYRVSAQAAGWEGARQRIDVAGTSHRQDFVLHETTDFIPQLAGDQMVAALPEDTSEHRRMKAVFVGVCTECHAANLVLHNRFDAGGWDAIIAAMSRIGAMNTFRERTSPVIEYFREDLAAYLAEMRGPGPSPMRFTVPPRPRGDGTLPVVYEYDLPLETGGYLLNNGSDWSLGGPSASGGGFGLHDATVDRDGHIWFTYNDRESAARTVGRIDPGTGRVTDFTYPRPDGRAATSHGILTAGDGRIWFNVNLRAPGQPGSEKLGRIDPRTETLEVFTPPGNMRGMAIHVAEDGAGHIWGDTATGAIRFDPTTRTFTAYTSLTQPGSTYGATGDRNGNGWWTQIGIDVVGHGDLATGRVSEVTLPATLPSFLQEGDFSREDLEIYASRGRGLQGPRRPAADLAAGDVWVPNYSGNNLMRIDIDTLETTHYPRRPRAGMNPYMAGVDSNRNVWVSLQGGDEVAKLDRATGQWSFYAWPSRGTGLRNLAVVNRDGRVEIVGAYFNAARIGRMVMRTRAELQRDAR